MSFSPRLIPLFLAVTLAAGSLRAEGPYSNRDFPSDDPDEPTYPIPYQKPRPEEIKAQMKAILAFLETAAPARLLDPRTRQPVDPKAPPLDAILDKGPENAFSPLDYTMGVVHSGMLYAAQVTGDRAFSDFTARRLAFIAETAPLLSGEGPKGAFKTVLNPAALDDCGAMDAALIQARLAGVGPDTTAIIERWTAYISKKQFRLPDGTLARPRPQAASLWADDFYMGIPALAYRAEQTGDRAYLDDASRDFLQTAARLFQPQTGLYAHGWNAVNPDAPAFYWGRANGWALLTLCDLLDVLPADHPDRPKLLALLKAHVRGVASLQSGQGLWHQLLDRDDSYLESSATAMFVYGIAHAIDRGWISAATYGSIAQAGWCGLSTRINAKGQVEGTCVGTTFASDAVYYYARPVSVYATHGYGPTLMAGAEMIRLLANPKIDVQTKLRTYHYVPKP